MTASAAGKGRRRESPARGQEYPSYPNQVPVDLTGVIIRHHHSRDWSTCAAAKSSANLRTTPWNDM